MTDVGLSELEQVNLVNAAVEVRAIPYCIFSQTLHLLEEVPLNWNKWIRQIHRWLSVAFTVSVIVNIVAIAQKKYTAGVGLLAVLPLAFLFLTGLYLFVLPYAVKWRNVRRAD